MLHTYDSLSKRYNRTAKTVSLEHPVDLSTKLAYITQSSEPFELVCPDVP